MTRWLPRSAGRFSVVVAIALALRALAVVLLDGVARAPATAHDEHASIARSLALGQGFRFNFFGDIERPALTSQQAPLVPYVLAACHYLGGLESATAWMLMLTLQCLAGGLTVGLLASAARRMAGRSARGACFTFWCVGLAAAVYPPVVVAGLHVQALAWNLLWLAMLLWGAVEYQFNLARDRTCWRALLALAGAGAGGMLTDPIFAAPLGLSLLTLAWRAIGWRRRIAELALVGLAVTVALAPWTLRNAITHGRFIMVKNSLPYVFWQGNNPWSWGTDKLPVNAARAAELSSVADPAAAQHAAFAVRAAAVSVNVGLTDAQLQQLAAADGEMARMELFGRWAWADLAANPGRYLGKCGWRLACWVGFDPTNPRSFLPHYQLSYGLLWLLAVPTLTLGWRHPLARPALAAALGYTLVHVLIITSARFRVPLELLLLLPAGGTLATAGRRLRMLSVWVNRRFRAAFIIRNPAMPPICSTP